MNAATELHRLVDDLPADVELIARTKLIEAAAALYAAGYVEGSRRGRRRALREQRAQLRELAEQVRGRYSPHDCADMLRRAAVAIEEED